jgi:hypothetical protein
MTRNRVDRLLIETDERLSPGLRSGVDNERAPPHSEDPESLSVVMKVPNKSIFHESGTFSFITEKLSALFLISNLVRQDLPNRCGRLERVARWVANNVSSLRVVNCQWV